MKILVAVMTAGLLGMLPFASHAQEAKQEKENKSAEAVAVGDKAPDFELETLDGKKVKLSDRFGDEGKNVVLLFSRAHW